MANIDYFVRATRRHLTHVYEWLRGLPVHKHHSTAEMPSIFRRACEQYALQIKNNISVDDYYELDLFKQEIPWQEKRMYLGQFANSRMYKHINEQAYDTMLRNKLVFQLVCESLNIHIVPILAVFSSKKNVYPRRHLRTSSDLQQFLEEGPRENIFFKNSTQSFGRGALSLGKYLGDDNWESLPKKNTISTAEILSHFDSSDDRAMQPLWLIQDTLVPHTALRDIVAGVCPTLRIMTLNTKGEVSLTDAMIRFGLGDSPVDNNHAGGVPFIVDNISGKVGCGTLKNGGRITEVSAHPKTGVEISDMIIPFWEEVRELAIESARKLPQIAYIGWDIVVTDNGPIILEANSSSRLVRLQTLTKKGLLHGALAGMLTESQGVIGSGISLPASCRK